jgi:hypothetical protein
VLDAILMGLVEHEKSVDQLVAEGFDRATVVRIERLLHLAEYKRRQAPPGVKLGTSAISGATGAIRSRRIKQVWPEPFMVNRPCCHAMTPDEVTLSALVRNARSGNRAGFAQAVDGFVRAERHPALYEATVHAVALLPSP